MPGTYTPGQMYDHELNPLKGWDRSLSVVDKSAGIASGVTGIQAGMACSLDSNGDWILGAPNPAVAGFAFPNQDDFDVQSDVGNISGGNLNCLMATGAYELESTEYVGAGFAPNVPLTCENAGADIGKLKVTTINSADNVIGVCSAALATNEYNKTWVRFWPVYLPSRA